MQSNKTLALGLLLAFSATSAQAVSCECFTKAWASYKGQWSALVNGVATLDKDGKPVVKDGAAVMDTSLSARFYGSYKGVFGTAAVVGGVALLVYHRAAIKAKLEAAKAKLSGKAA